jgi:hypothetical protein
VLAVVTGARTALPLSPSIDADADGWVDGVETQLGSDPADPVSTPESVANPPVCLDGADNDADGQLDLADPGCAPPQTFEDTFPSTGLDVFDSQMVLDAYPLVTPFGTCPVDFDARGPTVVSRAAPREAGGGLRAIDVEIVAMQLTGTATVLSAPGCALPAGAVPVTVFEDPAQASLGVVQDTNADPGRDFPADGFFDVFFRIDTPAGILDGGPPNGPAGAPVRVENSFNSLPPYQSGQNPNCYQVQGLTHEHCPKSPPDHFKCYTGKFPRFAKRTVTLEDQFSSRQARVLQPLFFCNPAAKDAEPLYEEAGHLECYTIKARKDRPAPVVRVYNQYGQETVKVKNPALLCLPTRKNALPEPVATDHYECYRGKFPRFEPRLVALVDQFGTEQTQVLKPRFLCNPVAKNGEPIRDRLTHLKCYDIRPKRTRQTITIANQFGSKSVTTKASKLLCVPSSKFGNESTTTTITVPDTTTTTTIPTTGGRSVTLDNQTGTMPPGTVLCLSRVTQACAAQADVCPGVHLHGPLFIDGQGPYPDPNPGACGHGRLGTSPSCGPDDVSPCN